MAQYAASLRSGESVCCSPRQEFASGVDTARRAGTSAESAARAVRPTELSAALSPHLSTGCGRPGSLPWAEIRPRGRSAVLETAFPSQPYTK